MIISGGEALMAGLEGRSARNLRKNAVCELSVISNSLKISDLHKITCLNQVGYFR